MSATEQAMRHALNKRIRHGKSLLQKKLRRKHWLRVLMHPDLILMVGSMIRERAAQPPLWPLLFENFNIGEVSCDT